MKNMEIRQLSTPDLVEKIKSERETLTKLKMNHAVSPIENPMKIRHQRRLIARLESELRKRELQEKKEPAPVE